MADNPDPTAPKVPGITVTNLGGEPAVFVYFDGVAALGTNHGAVQLELAANVIVALPGGTTRTDVVVTADLRCSPNAAADLRNAIEKALLMLVPKPDGPAN